MNYIYVATIAVLMTLRYEPKQEEKLTDKQLILIRSVAMWNEGCSQSEKRYDKYISCKELKKIIEKYKNEQNTKTSSSRNSI